jgi:prepilin-type processing-associated H-X9-DG protein
MQWVISLFPYMEGKPEYDGLRIIGDADGGLGMFWTGKYGSSGGTDLSELFANDGWDNIFNYHNGSRIFKAWEGLRCPSSVQKEYTHGVTVPSGTTDAGVNIGGQSVTLRIALHNYVCNVGNTGGGWYGQKGSPAWITLGGITVTFQGAPFEYTMNGDDNPIYKGIRDIADGTSNTLAFSEVAQVPDNCSTLVQFAQAVIGGAGDTLDNRGQVFAPFTGHFTTLFTPNSAEPDHQDNSGTAKTCISTTEFPCTGRFEGSMVSYGNSFCGIARSYHPGGVNAALCDGSVRFITENISWATWQALGTTRGGEVFEMP